MRDSLASILNAPVSTTADNEDNLPSNFKALVSTAVWSKRDNLASISKAQNNVGQFAFNALSSSHH